MPSLYYRHESFAEHDTGAWHPERPERLDAVERGAMTSGVELIRVEPPRVDRIDLRRIHPDAYVSAIHRFCEQGGGYLDQDTHVGTRSWEAALRSAGAGVDAIDRLGSGPVDTAAFLCIRPPGHHALTAQAMGFCLFNNIAVSAAKLVGDGARVAIVDWDVHHGNGTQAVFDDVAEVLYVSLHQHPFYPMTGLLTEVGTGAAKGTMVNIPLPAGSAGDVYRAAFSDLIVPVLSQFRPDWILVSAGFDAHADDPLAEMRLASSDYHAFAVDLAGVVPANRVVTFLEGGYSLPAITASVAAAMRGVDGLDYDGVAQSLASPPSSWEALEAARGVQSEYWNL